MCRSSAASIALSLLGLLVAPRSAVAADRTSPDVWPGADDAARTPLAATTAGPCETRWSLSGASRTESSKVDKLQLHLDLPRVNAECRELLEKQFSSEVVRIYVEDAGPSAAGSVACHMGYAHSRTLSWRCVFHWRDSGPGTEASEIVGFTAVGGPSGFTFQPAFPGCNAAARSELVATATGSLPSRLRESAGETAAKKGHLISTFRDGHGFFVSFGRAHPREGAESTVAKLTADRYQNQCAVKD